MSHLIFPKVPSLYLLINKCLFAMFELFWGLFEINDTDYLFQKVIRILAESGSTGLVLDGVVSYIRMAGS